MLLLGSLIFPWSGRSWSLVRETERSRQRQLGMESLMHGQVNALLWKYSYELSLLLQWKKRTST